MAIRSQVTALVLLTSTALVAGSFGCSSGTAGDGTSLFASPSGSAQEAPITEAQAQAPRRGRPVIPLSANRMGTTAIVAKLMAEDAGGGGAGEPDAGGGGPTWEASISTDKSTYAFGESIQVSFGSMSSDPDSWVTFAPQGADATVYGWYAYTNGIASGTATPASGDNLPPGTYVARAYFGNTYVIKGESAPFTVGAVSPAPGNTISIASGEGGSNEYFGGFETISATVSGLAASTQYDVGVFPTYGSTGLPWASATITTSLDGSATAEFNYLLSGVTYEIRVFEGSTWKLSSPSRFRVNPAVRAQKSSFGTSDAVEIEFAGMQGLSFFDKVVIAPVGSPDSAVTVSKNADWYWNGTLTFERPASGSYVARVFNGVGDTTTKQAETVGSFEIQ